MRTELQVLSPHECDLVHERTLHVLSTIGMRVDTARGRAILAEAGASVAGSLVRFPPDLVERSLKLAPRRFALGGRRPGWRHELNAGDFTLVADGGGTELLDRLSGERRPATFADWREATSVCDAIDDIGVYWAMVDSGFDTGTPTGMVSYLSHLFHLFGKHVQDSFDSPAASPWLLRTLEILFGSKDEIRRRHPFSFLLTPASPLVIEEHYTDTWLALRGYDIPVAVMPMPLMGGTAPASRLATVLQANCEVLGTLCLVQAAEPGAPFIYAPAIAVMDPRTGRYAGGAIEHYVLSVAAVEMARSYGLPVEASGAGSDHFVPCPQAAYEKAMSSLLATLPWPDMAVGPGMLAGATILSFEQLIMDVEMFRMARAAAAGITISDERWLDDVMAAVGPGGSFLAQPSTRRALRQAEWSLPRFGLHESFSAWQQRGAPTTVDEAREQVELLLAAHQPERLAHDVERELAQLLAKAHEAEQTRHTNQER
ncbi:MAG: trimethylamine methyltransferase family protein [Thermoleophilia bacterium]